MEMQSNVRELELDRGLLHTTRAGARTMLLVIGALGVLDLASGCGGGTESDGTSAPGTVRSALFDCSDPGQRLSCDVPTDPDKKFICHAANAKWIKISVAQSSAHVSGQPHQPGGLPDLDPGASANDVGITGHPGLDCNCSPRLCDNACSGAPDGVPCDDGDKCTGDGACQGGVCRAGVPSCAAGALDQCTVTTGTCDPSSGECVTAPVPDGASCSDANACTQNDSCQAGVCVGANPVACAALDACHLAGTCDPSTGACSNPPAPDGTVCATYPGGIIPTAPDGWADVCGGGVCQKTESCVCGLPDPFTGGCITGTYICAAL